MRRPRYVGQAAVNQAVLDLLGEFQYPDVEPHIPGFFPGGGGGAPTIVIAADNSLDIEKQKADYICTGVNDEAVIQQAIDQLLFGGRILLCAGTYAISFDGSANVITSGGFSGFTIEGMGTEATILDVTDSFSGSETDRFALEFTDADVAVKNLTLQGGDGATATNGIAIGNQGLIWNVNVATDGIGIRMDDGEVLVHATQVITGGDGIQLNGDDGQVSNCHIECGGDGIVLSTVTRTIVIGNVINVVGDCINATSATNLAITGNALRTSGGYGVFLTDDQCGWVTITGNAFTRCNDGAVRVDGGYAVKVEANNISETPFFAANPAILFDHSGTLALTEYGAQIVGNMLDAANAGGGISINDYDGAVVADNIVRQSQTHGILLTDANHTQITGNVVESSGQGGDNTADNIYITGASSRNMVTANKLRPAAGVIATRYGVNVAGGECNMVVGNDLGDPDEYGTDSLVDTGANTQLFWPADATYGDNFTDCGSGS